MATEVVMPQMGESIAEGTITKWLKNVGEHVDRDEPLFEISTDKVDAEIPAKAAGPAAVERPKPLITTEPERKPSPPPLAAHKTEVKPLVRKPDASRATESPARREHAEITAEELRRTKSSQ